MIERRQLLRAALGAAGLTALGLHGARVHAQQVELLRILYGFPAGSAGDIVARRVGEKMVGSEFVRGNAIVENKPGAGGRIALSLLKQAAPDGTTLALSPFSCTSIYPHVYQRLDYDPVKDLTPVGTAALIFHGLAVGPVVPESVKDVRGFLAWAKANPQLANCGSPAAGSTPHFIGALLGLMNDVPLNHVPYRGSVPGVADVVGGQIAAMVTPSGDFIANHRAGRLRVLATSGTRRSPFLPEVPTFAEQGFAPLTVEEWFGFYAPAGTPAALVARANAAIVAALKDPAVVDALAVVGLIVHPSTPQEMAASQAAEHERWGPLVKRIGFTGDS